MCLEKAGLEHRWITIGKLIRKLKKIPEKINVFISIAHFLSKANDMELVTS